MDSYADVLSPADVETVRRALQASVEGGFFPDWEFSTLFGVDRDIVRKVYQAGRSVVLALKNLVVP